MTRRRDLIPQKVPALLFGEGLSEQGYGRWLNHLAKTHGVPVHIRSEKLRGSDPLDLVSQAIEKHTIIRRSLGKYKLRALLLDADLRGQNPERDAIAIKTATQKTLHLIWQAPCHEAFLLRHFPGKHMDQPATLKDAFSRLRRVWPGYDKGLNATHYGKVLTLDHLLRGRAVEAGLDEFLVRIGWN